MVLQELQFPNSDTCSTLEMYFHHRKGEHACWMDPELGALCMPKWTHLDLDTYFNSFSLGKWRHYTQLSNLTLRLELRGEVQVQLIHWEMVGSKTFQHVLFERVCKAEEREQFDFVIPLDIPDRGIVCCSLYAIGDDCAVFGGAYMTEIEAEKLNEVDIAIDICTFKREAFIERNIALLNRSIIQNSDCDMYGHLDVFISDNGQTLDIQRLQSNCIHIFKNRNTGGSGGFARGMMEIIDYSEKRPFSHVLVMDDDVLINVYGLLLNYRLLRMLKPAYLGKTIAGAMLRLDNRWKQHECCGTWNGRFVKRGKKSMDLRELECVLQNEMEVPFDFNAWWYSCIPISKITNDNLPIPMFIRMDDVEFGLRTGSDILTMNGICLWHENFANKFASSMDYYEIRNLLVLNSLRKPDMNWKQGCARMMYRIVANIVRYRYKDCELVLWGVKDFLAGADAFMTRDAEELHKRVLEASDKFVPLDELEIRFDEKQYRRSLKKRKRGGLHTFRLYLLNGLFLPPKAPTVVDAFLSPPWETYRRKALLHYSELNQRGFVTHRSVRKSLSYIFRGLGMCIELMRHYEEVARGYREAEPIMTSRSFWNEYLGLK